MASIYVFWFRVCQLNFELLIDFSNLKLQPYSGPYLVRCESQKFVANVGEQASSFTYLLQAVPAISMYCLNDFSHLLCFLLLANQRTSISFFGNDRLPCHKALAHFHPCSFQQAARCPRHFPSLSILPSVLIENSSCYYSARNCLIEKLPSLKGPACGSDLPRNY